MHFAVIRVVAYDGDMLEFLSYVFIIIGLSALVIVHEAGHFVAAKLSGILVEEFGFGLPPRITGKKFGETLVSLNWLPFGGFVRLYGESQIDPHSAQGSGEAREKSGAPVARSFSHQKIATRASVIVAGVVMNFLLGWLLLSMVFMLGIPQTLLVTDVKAGSAADMAGIRQEDQVLGFPTVAELTKYLEANSGKEVRLNIRRADAELTVPVKLPATATKDGGRLGTYLVEAGTPKQGFFRSIADGFTEAAQESYMIFLALMDLIAGIFARAGIFGRFVGPVGIVNIAVQTTKLGTANFLQLLATLSLNLAVFNVMPFPALDGGRLLFLCVEKLRGRKMDSKVEMTFNAVGFLILILLIAAITIGDILRVL